MAAVCSPAERSRRPFSNIRSKDANDFQKVKNALMENPDLNAVDTSSDNWLIAITIEKHPDLACLQKSVLKQAIIL